MLSLGNGEAYIHTRHDKESIEKCHEEIVNDFEKYYKDGYRGVIFAIDNTLVPHGAPADAKAVALFNRLKELGFSSVLLSNNKEPRVKMFFDGVCASHYIYKGGKPSGPRRTHGHRQYADKPARVF